MVEPLSEAMIRGLAGARNTVTVEELLREIDSLLADVRRLRAALRPFAGMAEQADRENLQDGNSIPVLAGWCRDARAALAASPAREDVG